MSDRRGFAMLTTLWVMSVAAIVTLTAAIVGRNAVSAGSHRVQMERARWMAAGCGRRAEAAIDDALRAAPTLDEAAIVWRTLDRTVAASPLLLGADCDVQLEAAGTRLDVNAATEEMIVNLLSAVGAADGAPERAAAMMDWRDTDDVANPLGAERSWYDGAHRFPPRNDAFADVMELRRVRGFEDGGAWEAYLTNDPGRVSLATAPVPVLMAVPGITRETAERIVELHDAGTPVRDLLQVTASVSEESVSALAARYPEASRATTADPDAWVVRSRYTRGRPAVTVMLEWRMIRAGRRCMITYTRSYL